MGKVILARRHVRGTNAPFKIVSFLMLGITIGGCLGYGLMSTAHSIMEISGKNSQSQRDASTNSKQQPLDNTKGTQKTTSTSANSGSSTTGKNTLAGDAIHVLTTSNGSPYQNYQMRIAYATYQLVLEMPGGDRFKGFTRILHRTQPDELMDEIPTFRANPLQPLCDHWCEYPVSDRADAMQQFFDAYKKDPSMLKAPWLYMIESDYVFMKPVEVPPPKTKTTAGKAWAFPFDYINASAFPSEMKKLWPEGQTHLIPNAGPAPLVMSVEDWIAVTPDWVRLSAEIEADEHMKKALGWVREMYGFSIALAKNGVDVDLTPPGSNKLISQLPIDNSLGNAHAFHYTQCTIYKTIAGDDDVWKYDKRFYTSPQVALKVPLIEEPPEKFEYGKWKFIEGNPVTEEKHEAIKSMIKQMNRGIERLKENFPVEK